VFSHIARDNVERSYHKDDGPAPEKLALQALVDNPYGRVHIESRKDIVEEENLGRRVHCTGEGNTSLLAPTTSNRLAVFNPSNGR
jgi:hypothetical protein